MDSQPSESNRTISLHQVVMHYEGHDCYLSAMATVEEKRGEMLAELSEWSGQPLAEVVQFIGDLCFGGRIGLTFDEQLSATYAKAHVDWIWKDKPQPKAEPLREKSVAVHTLFSG